MNSTDQSPHPIACLSLNPAIDLTYEINSLEHEKKSRALTTSYDPGGTAINVGRALQILNANAYTCYICAGKMGDFLDSMLSHELANKIPFKVEGETRINTTILQKSPKFQYEINASGPQISATQLNKVVSKFLSLCQHGIGILSGSLPPGVDDSIYQRISRDIQNQRGRVIIDAPLAALKKSLLSQPFLIKPNLHELELLQHKTLNSFEQIASEARQITQQGTTYVCTSLAENGAILTGPDNSYYCPSPAIKVCSTVGAGDSLLAGLAYAFSHQQSPEQALKLAVACGAGTAEQPGTELFKLESLPHLLDQITIKVLDI